MSWLVLPRTHDAVNDPIPSQLIASPMNNQTIRLCLYKQHAGSELRYARRLPFCCPSSSSGCLSQKPDRACLGRRQLIAFSLLWLFQAFLAFFAIFVGTRKSISFLDTNSLLMTGMFRVSPELPMHDTGTRMHEHLSRVIYLSHVALSTGAGDLPHDLKLMTVIIVCDVQLFLDCMPPHLFRSILWSSSATASCLTCVPHNLFRYQATLNTSCINLKMC